MIVSLDHWVWFLNCIDDPVVWRTGSKLYHRPLATAPIPYKRSIVLRCKRTASAWLAMDRAEAVDYGLQPCGTCYR